MEEWNQSSLFDLLPENDPMRIALTPLSSTDWKWSFKDYPPKNGLKVFSCFACGGGRLWDINSPGAMLSVVVR